MTNELLATLAEEQSKLISTDQMLRAQITKQGELSAQMIGYSKNLICELRLLSLVRAKIINSRNTAVEKILKSQTFKGLRFSNIELCPDFTDSNKLNYYMNFTDYMRRHPKTLATVLFKFAQKHPDRMTKASYSLFLSLFQQGWCHEEDELLFQTLIAMADLQFSSDNNDIECQIPLEPPRLLQRPLSAIESSVSKYHPFVSFATAYLFNGASFAYLQSSLAPIILKLHSLSKLYDLRTTFQIDPETSAVAPFKYWSKLVTYAKQIFLALIRCLELLPSGFFQLFAHLKSLGADLYLVFFESFINRALDNPAVLGLLPWHPQHGNWRPAKDIADIFRTKSLNSLPIKSLIILAQVLMTFPEYNDIDLDTLLDLISSPSQHNYYMINETELLSTNPTFPKELLITGADLCLLQEAALSLTNEEIKQIDPDLIKPLERLGDVLEKNKYFGDHFRIVITRKKEATAAAKAVVSVSLFSNKSSDSVKKESDPFAEQLCDIISTLPSFENSIKAFQSNTVLDFFKHLLTIAPLFIPANNLLLAESVIWYVNTAASEAALVERISAVTERKNVRTLQTVDRTSSLQSQHQRILSSLEVVSDIRTNVQSHLLLQIAECFVSDTMSNQFKEAMYRGHEFVSDISLFKKIINSMIETALLKLEQFQVSKEFNGQICRILFFKLTDHVTFRSYVLSISQTNVTLYKHSVIIQNLVKKHKEETLTGLATKQGDIFKQKIDYLKRASDLLGHIRNNSSVSVILYYVLEMSSFVKTLCDNCRDLSFDACLIWALIKTKCRGVYLVNKFIQHFVLKVGFIDTIFTDKEITLLGIFNSAVLMMLNELKQYDARITDEWA